MQQQSHAYVFPIWGRLHVTCHWLRLNWLPYTFAPYLVNTTLYTL